jgi:hypothetical protein
MGFTRNEIELFIEIARETNHSFLPSFAIYDDSTHFFYYSISMENDISYNSVYSYIILDGVWYL